MRHWIPFLAICLLLSVASRAWSAENEQFDWKQWRQLPVQEGGRHKPLDTLAWETLRTLANRTSLQDPDSGQRLDATTLYLVLLFDWQGWDQPLDPVSLTGGHGPSSYTKLHQPDKWDRSPMLRVDYLELRTALGMDEDEKYISPTDLSSAKIKMPGVYDEKLFLRWAESLIPQQQQGLTTFEEKSLQLADKFWSYQDHRMGNRLELVPIQGSEHGEWLSLSALMRANFDDRTDPTGKMREAQEQFRAARSAYFDSSGADFNQASASFLSVVRALGPSLGNYPVQSQIDLEILYNRWAPFRFGWVLMTLTFILLLLSMGTRWRLFYVAGWTAAVAGFAAIVVGFIMRVAISGRAPVTNMYESVVYVGLGVAFFGMLFELIYRKKYILTASAAVATITLILADNCPAVLDPSLRPLQPVLRSNFWLVTHVMTITLSYAALALALGIGNITLGYYLAGSTNRKAIDGLTNFTYRAIQVGVLLLAAGTILGGVWADYSWGRFWGWDPKEVWALVALLGYLAVLHARSADWVRQFGLAALSVLCFALVVMAWYGVNFVLGAGLHSYGFGGGGQKYVFTVLGVQGLFVLAAGIRYAYQQAMERQDAVYRVSIACPSNGNAAT